MDFRFGTKLQVWVIQQVSNSLLLQTPLDHYSVLIFTKVRFSTNHKKNYSVSIKFTIQYLQKLLNPYSVIFTKLTIGLEQKHNIGHQTNMKFTTQYLQNLFDNYNSTRHPY